MNYRNALRESIEAVTASHGLFYTERQLYYMLCRQLQPPPLAQARRARWLGVGGLVPALALLRWRKPRHAVALVAAGVLPYLALRLVHEWPFTMAPPLTYPEFEELLATYIAGCGSPPGLLQPAPVTAPSWPASEPDLSDYGLPRLLLCQDVTIAHMLLANGFHMELSCAILPLATAQPLPPTVCKMLARTPEAHVYLLHDASWEGVQTLLHLRQRLQLPDRVPLTALGLRPRQAQQMHLSADHISPPTEDTLANLPSGLTTGEQRWLQRGWRAEVAAIAPVNLLRGLRRSMLAPKAPRFRLPSPQRERVVGFLTWPDETS